MMTEEMRKAAEALGDLLKDSDEVKAANAAKAVYDNDEAVQQAIFEYNTQNAVLAKEYQKDEKDEVFTGERPQSACTGNCSSCGGCH